MKIVIDISDNDYEYIKGLNEGITDYHTTVKLYRSVRGGTVLPKGHGDLIERNNIETYITKEFKGKLTENEADLFVQFTNVTDEIPAIIEADKENDNER